MSQDRNAVARQEFAQRQQSAAAKKARETFVGDFQLGRAGALDRFGNMVREGDSVIFKMPNDPVMTVVSVTPSMDPNHPIGAIKMVLSCEVPVLFGANQPSQSMIRIGNKAQIEAIEERVRQAEAAGGPHNGQEATTAGPGAGVDSPNGHVQQPPADGNAADPGDSPDADDDTDG